MNGPLEQGELFFQPGDGDGYASFQAELEGRIDELGRRMGLPLNRTVRIRLVHSDEEYEGVLRLASSKPLKETNARVRLKLGDRIFEQNEIVSCQRVDAT